MNKYRTYIRKRKHIDFVRDYVCELHNTIFHNALNGEVKLHKNIMYKKYSKYLKLLEF
jgi:hypothetical protein